MKSEKAPGEDDGCAKLIKYEMWFMTRGRKSVGQFGKWRKYQESGIIIVLHLHTKQEKQKTRIT